MEVRGLSNGSFCSQMSSKRSFTHLMSIRPSMAIALPSSLLIFIVQQEREEGGRQYKKLEMSKIIQVKNVLISSKKFF